MLERLARIERLQDDGGSRQALLAELSELLEEGEAWLSAEPDGTERAAELLALCRERLEVGESVPAPA